MRDNFVPCNQEFHQYQNPVKSFCFSKGVEFSVANGMASLQIHRRLYLRKVSSTLSTSYLPCQLDVVTVTNCVLFYGVSWCSRSLCNIQWQRAIYRNCTAKI